MSMDTADFEDLNFECDEVREAVYDLMRFWVEKGCDGYRVSPRHFGDNATADN